MDRKSARIACALLALALVSGAMPAGAAEDKKGGEQIRRLQQKLMALQREQGELAQGKAALDEQVKHQAAELARARAGADGARAGNARLEKALAAAEADKAALAGKLAETEQAVREKDTLLAASSAALRATESARAQLEQALAQRSQSLAECGAKNESLHQTGTAALKLYQEKSCLGNAAQLEMLTRLRQVRTENMVDELRDKLDAAALKTQADRRRQEQAERQAEREREQRQLADAERARQARAEQTKARQQGDIDRFATRVKGWLENIEW
jgi:hypothetical protein